MTNSTRPQESIEPSSRAPWRLAAGFLLVFAALLVLAFTRVSDPWTQLWSGIIVGLPSAALAVVLGLPIAIYIAISQQRDQERQQRAAEERQRQEQLADEQERENERRRAEAKATAEQRLIVLSLVKDELETDRRTLRLRANLQHDIEPSSGSIMRYDIDMPAAALSAEVWKALSASDSLKSVEPKLLGALAKAYNMVETMRELEMLSHTARGLTGNATVAILRDLAIYAVDAVAFVESALKAIGEATIKTQENRAR